MIKRIKEKLREIEIHGDELKTILPHSLYSYKIDLKAKAACERYFERIIESIIDVSYLVAKNKKIKVGEGEKIFHLLADKGIISKRLYVQLKKAKAMRNILVHEYGNIDDQIVFCSLTKELHRDIEEFLASIKKIL